MYNGRKSEFKMALTNWGNNLGSNDDDFAIEEEKSEETMRKPLICLLKSEESSKSTKKASMESQLRSAGYKVRLVPTLQFTLDHVKLTERLSAPASYAGIIFTSPRAVEACADAFGEQASSWSGKMAFSVGEKTSALIRKCLPALSVVEDSAQSGNAAKLAPFICRVMEDRASEDRKSTL